MSDRADYLTSIIPEPFRVLGLALRPFSLGHLLLLSRIKSPLISGEDATQSDLLLGVLICSSTFEDGERLIADAGAMHRALDRLRSTIGQGILRRRKLNWEEAAEVFAEYLRDGQRQADVWKHQGNGPGMTSPWQEIVSITVARSGWTESQILNCYLPRLLIRYYAITEVLMFERATSADSIRRIFVSPDEREIMDRKKCLSRS